MNIQQEGTKIFSAAFPLQLGKQSQAETAASRWFQTPFDEIAGTNSNITQDRKSVV